MKRFQLISNGALIRLVETAKAAWDRCDYEQSIDLLERGNRMKPGDCGILLDLGLSYAMNYDYCAAEQCFERAVRFSSRKAETLAAAGAHWQHLGRHEKATSFFERASRENGLRPETLANLAELYERQRRMDDAAAMVSRALEADAGCPPALLTRARMTRRSGNLDDAEGFARTALTKVNGDAWMRAQTLYEIGAILDQQGRYDDAMAAFLEAKAALCSDPNYPRALAALRAMQRNIVEMQQSVTAEAFQRWTEAGKAPKPARKLALLCGHPRSGTTLLEQVLDSHPQIVSAEETSICYEKVCLPLTRNAPPGVSAASVLDAALPPRLQQLRQIYFRTTERFLGAAIGDRWLIDKNPTLTLAIPSIVRAFPEIKFLVALRDPRDVCLSCFMQPLPLNPASCAYLTMKEAVADYASTIGFWTTMRPRLANPAIEIRYEDMVDNLESVARRVLEFLGVPWDPEVLRFDSHARSKVVLSPTYAEVTKPIFKSAVGRWRNYEKYMAPHMEKLAPLAKELGYS